jgi:2-C-methyl-D-erythritol 4-phosphate cytidylyltransferase/2-C-methyl-D-erythritol 2,4-cyclodiphosphate synthase
MHENPRTIALIVAAGSGERAGLGSPKQFVRVAGKPVLRHAVERLLAHTRVGAVRVMIGEGQQALSKRL